MNSYYIRSADRATVIAGLVAVGILVDDADGLRASTAEIVWDEIGPVCEPTGDTDDDGLPIMTPVIDGDGVPYWHANIYSTAALDLPDEYLLAPSAPCRELWLETP